MAVLFILLISIRKYCRQSGNAHIKYIKAPTITDSTSPPIPLTALCKRSSDKSMTTDEMSGKKNSVKLILTTLPSLISAQIQTMLALTMDAIGRANIFMLGIGAKIKTSAILNIPPIKLKARL